MVGAILGVVADLDFLPGLLLGDPSRFHHAMTHSILMIVIAAAIAAAIARLDRLRWMLIASLAYGSHLALDMITHDDTPPFGIPLFWPASSEFFASPVWLFPRVIHSDGSPFVMHNVLVAALEIALLVPLFVWAVQAHATGRSQ